MSERMVAHLGLVVAASGAIRVAAADDPEEALADAVALASESDLELPMDCYVLTLDLPAPAARKLLATIPERAAGQVTLTVEEVTTDE